MLEVSSENVYGEVRRKTCVDILIMGLISRVYRVEDVDIKYSFKWTGRHVMRYASTFRMITLPMVTIVGEGNLAGTR
jgi:hypothetical protein